MVVKTGHVSSFNLQACDEGRSWVLQQPCAEGVTFGLCAPVRNDCISCQGRCFSPGAADQSAGLQALLKGDVLQRLRQDSNWELLAVIVAVAAAWILWTCVQREGLVSESCRVVEVLRWQFCQALPCCWT